MQLQRNRSKSHANRKQSKAHITTVRTLWSANNFEIVAREWFTKHSPN